MLPGVISEPSLFLNYISYIEKKIEKKAAWSWKFAHLLVSGNEINFPEMSTNCTRCHCLIIEELMETTTATATKTSLTKSFHGQK